jgi:hypothetical protein
MNITLSADEELVRRAREGARRQGKSLNALIREYLGALGAARGGAGAAAELFALMDEGRGSLRGRRWNRDELHER